MKQGTLFYDRESGRYNFHYTDEDGDRRDYGGIHCGEVFEFCLNDVWVPARMEMGMDDRWYLVGLPGLALDVRQGQQTVLEANCQYGDETGTGLIKFH